MTTGARPGLLRLHRDFGERVRFVLVFVREAHPGERYPAHRSFEQKMRHACDLVALRPWINPGNRDLPCTVREEVREEGA